MLAFLSIIPLLPPYSWLQYVPLRISWAVWTHRRLGEQYTKSILVLLSSRASPGNQTDDIKRAWWTIRLVKFHVDIKTMSRHTHCLSLSRSNHCDRSIHFIVPVRSTPGGQCSRHIQVPPHIPAYRKTNWAGKLTAPCERGATTWLPLESEHCENQCFPNTTSILSPCRHTNRVLLGDRDCMLERSTYHQQHKEH